MRRLIAYFIKYGVAVNVLLLGFLLFGVFGMLQLKSSYLPLQDPKNININITYPGAAPQEIEEGIILKIEDNLKGLKGIERVTSTARENGGNIAIEIQTDEDINDMLPEVKNAVDRVPNFPTGMEPLVVSKQEIFRQTMVFAISGKNVDLVTLKQIGREIENDLRGMEGISQVNVSGYPQEEIEIAVREDDLLAYNLTFSEVADAVAKANILSTGGNIKTEAEDYLIRANSRSYYGVELNNLPVRAREDGTIVHLQDVATIRDRFSETPNASYFNGNPSVNIEVTNTNSEDLLGTAEKLNKYINEFNQKYTGVKIDIVRDNGVTLNTRKHILLKNGIMGIILVLIFLSLFLNTRLAYWVALGLPISFLGMFMFASFFNITLNLVSLFGMIIVVGILVDDGIVISENIYQHYEKGKPRIQAAIDGTMEVLPPIVSAVVTTVLAFSSILFLEGRIGDIFSEVSIIVILTLLVSLLEALLILPAHIAHSKALEKVSEKEKKRKKGIEKIFLTLRKYNEFGERLMRFLRDTLYSPVLRFALRQRFITFAILLAILILTIGAFQAGIIKSAFFPNLDSDTVSINLLMPEGTNPKITDSIISMVEDASWHVNDDYTKRQTGHKQVVQNIVKNVGPGNNKASLNVNLLPGEERDFSSSEITAAIRKEVGEVYGVELLTFGSGRHFGGSPISISLLGNNTEELKAATAELRSNLESNPQLTDITDTDPEGIKEINIELKPSAYALGLNLRDVMAQVRSGFFGLQAQRFQRGQDEIKVWVRYDRSNRESINDLDDMRIMAHNGRRIPFGEIATYEIKRGEESIRHLDGLREIQVNADLTNVKDSPTEILSNIREHIMPDILSKYPTIKASYEGQNREANKLLRSAKITIPAMIFLIYVVIAFTFRSYSQPLILMLMIPFSIIAVAWGHWIHGFPINISSGLGIIALVGIMVNDGLVLIGKFNSMLISGMSYDEALYEASRNRFRAIFLTSLTTIAGIAPLLLEKSRAAQFLQPMAISIAYGIFMATILTLIILPVLLSATNSAKVNIKWLATGHSVKKEEVERAIKELDKGYEY